MNANIISDNTNTTSNEIKTDVDNNLCVVCLIDEKTSIMIPCGHKCICKICGDKIRVTSNKCPMCNQAVIHVLHKIYD